MPYPLLFDSRGLFVNPRRILMYLYKPSSYNPEVIGEEICYSGDLAYQDEDGFIWFVGRKKQIIIRGGSNISPQEVENVLKNISIVNGYVIDYVYRYDRWSGEPLLYFRKIDEKPIESSDDWAKHKRNENLLDYIVVNGLPESFFELAIFNRMSKRFYLYLHSNYMKQEIVSTKNSLNELIKKSSEGKFGKKFPLSMKEFLKSIYPNPIVEINEYHVFVHYCYFNEWSGFYRVKECFNIYRPHRMVDTKIIHEIKYDNGCII